MTSNNKRKTAKPAMSVIITTTDNFQTIQTTISYLQNQTVNETLEIIIVAPDANRLQLDETKLSDFHSYKIAEVVKVDSVAQANTAGIEKASAEIIAFIEDHSFPQPEWAENMIKTHKGPWAAVGPLIQNANPDTLLSWADLFIGYGPWLSSPGGEVDFLPGHNSSYKFDVLLAYRKTLQSMLASETVLHWDLRSKGHSLYLEPKAKVSHTNYSLWPIFIVAHFYGGWVFAGSRIHEMPTSKRLFYFFGSPLIPLIRVLRIASFIHSAKLLSKFFLSLPIILLGLSLDAAGQMVGYAFGIGDAMKKLARFEFRRIDHIKKREREEIFA